MEIVELTSDSVQLGEAVRLLHRIEAEGVTGPMPPAHPESLSATWRTGEFSRWMAAALDGDRVVGVASGVMFHHGNSHLVDLDLAVAHSHRRQGVATQLWHRVRRATAAHGGHTVVGYVGEALGGADVWDRHRAAVADPELSVTIPAGDPAGRAFAASVGAQQVQSELFSRLDLPGGGAAPGAALPTMLAPLDEQIAEHAAEYVVSTHVGVPPADVRVGLARLVARMLTDPPLGGLDLRPDEYTVERLEAGVAATLAGGQLTLWAVARRRDTAEVVAMTDLLVRPDEPHWAHQHDTIVDPPHRGHRLGFAVKAAALRRLVVEHPLVRHIHTWNALENGPMVAVNRVLGYRPVGLVAIVQHRLRPTRT